MYLADEANRDSLEFRRKIGANVQYHHDQELQSDVNQANVRQHDHDNGKKHFAEQVSVRFFFCKKWQTILNKSTMQRTVDS